MGSVEEGTQHNQPWSVVPTEKDPASFAEHDKNWQKSTFTSTFGEIEKHPPPPVYDMPSKEQRMKDV